VSGGRQQVDSERRKYAQDQPKRRVPVTRRILAELDRAGNMPLVPDFLGWPGYPGPLVGLPEGRSYVELAQAVYEVEEPSAANVKAVQRAAKRLVAAGQIEQRKVGGEVVLRRLMTAADHEYRAEVERQVQEYREVRAEARANASTYPIDRGYPGVIEVEVEPVLQILNGTVEVREAAAT
jgi:hypothetical protein